MQLWVNVNPPHPTLSRQGERGSVKSNAITSFVAGMRLYLFPLPSMGEDEGEGVLIKTGDL